MAEFKLDKKTILNKALIYENHPDNIAPATLGGFVSSVTQNDKVYFQKANLSDEIKAVVVIPNKAMSTSQSRTKLPKSISLKDAVTNLSHASFLASCFFAKDYDDLKVAAKDTIHENSRMEALPELFEVRNLAYKNGALLSTLSGSGSSFLNITYKDDAKKLSEILVKKFPEFRTQIFDFDNDGFKIL